MKLTDFLDGIGRPVAYYPSLVKITGSVGAGIFLCQLLYWKGKEADPEGWIFKTQGEISEETGLTRSEQETARKLLRERGLLEEKRAGIPARLYFNPCIDKINDSWSKVSEEAKKTLKNQQNAGNLQTSMRETRILECGKPAD